MPAARENESAAPRAALMPRVTAARFTRCQHYAMMLIRARYSASVLRALFIFFDAATPMLPLPDFAAFR